ncbi:hypothetical protein [Actinomycetospora lemnae]|uniref:Uncharacterized protein n=1 Tax=Actinomycetospora lemnae TaxID=3019891 RepID=A0ABT5SYT1_9PSEU|nr:hypothetical protein [Actinomycetospora sp. DW7H6]MDD7966873.1 hypothetical protein [Actinomycetospora sp. DW7H6]
MKTITLVLGGLGGLAVTSWVAAPTVSMSTRGTIDQRTRAAWRAVPRDVAPVAVVPAQRRVPGVERIPA